ncbi:odorant receptor 45b-like isoform X2 [Cylas formicarius]|uniref:odorant receptor 45b-like isoform X2 n=1 Tax=Cylas formicarius TaxID=197179 RepID=UPI0029589076|nr:odorant receptor 45b-like isoform X2 [Cylas formicarius]
MTGRQCVKGIGYRCVCYKSIRRHYTVLPVFRPQRDMSEPRALILDHAIFCMILAGIWPLALPTKRQIFRVAYSVYSIFVRMYFPIFLVSLSVQFTISTINGKDADQMFGQLIYVIAVMNGGIGALLYQRVDFKEIINYITKDDKDVGYMEDEQIKRCHLEQARFCKQARVAVTMLTMGGTTSICLENLWIRYQIGQYNKHYNDSLEKPFPFDLYYFGLNKEKHAGLLLIINDVSVMANGLLVASTKIVFFSCMIYPVSILKRLQIRLERWDVCDGLVVLKELIMHHQDIIRFITKLNGSIKYLIFMEFLLNSLNIAAVSIQFITFEKTMLASPILFFGILFTQTFVLGWSANEIKVQSLMLADALYRSPWYEQNETVKKMVLTMIMRAQTPLVLTIGPFDAMTTQSALAIMKGSYSYVSVMLNNYQ